jgi:hypothetical protein
VIFYELSMIIVLAVRLRESLFCQVIVGRAIVSVMDVAPFGRDGDRRDVHGDTGSSVSISVSVNVIL